MIPSMSGKGNCYGNAMVETVFKTIKSELVWRTSFLTRRQAEKAIGPLHRRVLQSDATTFRTRLHLAHQVRGPRWQIQTERLSTNSGQVQTRCRGGTGQAGIVTGQGAHDGAGIRPRGLDRAVGRSASRACGSAGTLSAGTIGSIIRARTGSSTEGTWHPFR